MADPKVQSAILRQKEVMMMNGIKPRKEDYEAALISMCADKTQRAGFDVDVRNVRIMRRNKVVVADVIYRDTFDYHTERFNDEQYPLDKVEAEAVRIRDERIKVKK